MAASRSSFTSFTLELMSHSDDEESSIPVSSFTIINDSESLFIFVSSSSPLSGEKCSSWIFFLFLSEMAGVLEVGSDPRPRGDFTDCILGALLVTAG